ncbi:hypothetical protein [Coleofasciculus sp. LEGE 07092]|uniref:hypothetical protein n=1 Tax=Coleofasciculus sp. LEGE 07092 TaxID=2777969 RepID=UPI0018801635|nr:hypothetical protein [Coleofasciculus sp. LEGE 07092]MBE9151058.1 hypothetical protein [Coleofasciculus sp. LEGE 07092]
MSQLIYPNLFCFVYDIKEGLGFNKEELRDAQANFAHRLPHLSYVFKNDHNFETEYHELLPTKIDKFTDQEDGYTGYYYPVRLNDTYGLLVACSPPENSQIYSANQVIANLKKKIDDKLADQPGTLGTTWVILAHLPENYHKDWSKVAQDCYQALMGNSDPQTPADWETDLVGQGKFLGGTLFELSQYHIRPNLKYRSHRKGSNFENYNSTSLAELQVSNHVLIELYPNYSAAKIASRFNFDWIRLFCYRHKILFAYTQSRFIKQELKEGYRTIKEFMGLFQKERQSNPNLRQLKRKLLQAQYSLYHYSIDLNQFADQIRTMEVNLLNYERRVKVIQEKARKETQEKAISDYDYLSLWGWDLRSLDWQSLPNSILDFVSPHDFSFLDEFRQDFSNKYMLQVEKDYEGLSPGLILLEELINSIYGITNLDQAQRDRTFQNTVAIVGVGLAAGSMVVSLNKLGEGKNDPVRSVLTHSLKIQPPWLEPAIPLVYSLSTAILAALFTWLVIRLKERSR